jgi:hypothetical protein
MLLASVGLLFGGLLWGWLVTIVGLHITFHIATLAIMLSMPLCVIWSLDPIDRIWRLAVCESGCNWVDLVGGVSKQAMQVTFDFKVPVEATQRFEDLVARAQTDFVRWGASHFRILNVVSNPCDYRIEIIFSSEVRFREFEIDQGAKVSDAWKQSKDCAVQTEYELALIHYPSPRTALQGTDERKARKKLLGEG